MGKIKIMKFEIQKNDFLYITEGGIVGSLMRDPFYRMELYRSTPIRETVISLESLWDTLSVEKYDIHLKDYPISVETITEEMENKLLLEMTQVEMNQVENIEGYELISMSCKNSSLIIWVINLFALGMKLWNH